MAVNLVPLAPANDAHASDEVEVTHWLTAEGYIACKGLHVLRNVRLQLGFLVTNDPERVSCPSCVAVRTRGVA
jgi:hypothetical protein